MGKDEKSNKKFSSPLDIKKQERLKAAIKESGLSQAEVARQAGIDPKYLSMFVTGNREITDKTMLNIAPIIDCDLKYLLCEQDHKNWFELEVQRHEEYTENAEREETNFLNFLLDFMNIESIKAHRTHKTSLGIKIIDEYVLTDREPDPTGRKNKYYLTRQQLNILKDQIMLFAETQKRILKRNNRTSSETYNKFVDNMPNIIELLSRQAYRDLQQSQDDTE